MPLDPFGPSAGLDNSVPVAGLDPFAPDPNAPGAFSKGIKVGVGGVKSSLYGAGALAARAVGAKELEQSALDKAAAAQEEVAADQQTIEQVDWTSPSSIADQFKFLLGQAIPSIGMAVAGGVVGRGVGTAVARRTGSQAAQRVGTIGGAVAPSFAMEAGSIFPEALETGVENPGTRAAVGGAVAASLDFLPILAAERYLKAAGKGGFGSLAKGAAKGAPVGAVLEGGQEAAQTAVERIAAGQDLSSPEAISDYLNSFAGGAVPGSILGAGVGAARGRRAAQPPAPPAPVQQPVVEEQPQPLPEILTGQALETQLSDQALFSSLNPPDGGPPGPPNAGPEVQPQPGYNRTFAPVAQESDFTNLETLRGQRLAARERMDALIQEAKQPEGQRRKLEEIAIERQTLSPQIDALNKSVLDLEQTIRNRFAAEDTAAIIEGAPKKERATEPFFTESGAFKRPQGEPTEAAELEVARQKRSVGALVSAREAKLLRAADAAVPAAPVVEPVTGNAPRERFRQESPARRAEVIEGVATQAVETHKKGLKFRKGTEPRITAALNKAVVEASTAPTIEEAEKRIFDAAIKALSGSVNQTDAETFAESVAKDVRSAPTFYSQAAAVQNAVVEFSHWGTATTQTDPSRMGTGVTGADWPLAQQVGLQYTSAVVRGSSYSEPYVQGKPERVGVLDANKVYSARTDDPMLIQAKADLRSQGIFNDALAWMMYTKQVRDLGYDAMLYANGQLRIFTPQRVRAASRAAAAPTKLSDLLAPLGPIAMTHATAGGSSTNLVTGQDLGGTDNYTVSVFKSREKTFKQAPTEADLRAYVEKNVDLLADPQNILGTWYNRADKLHYVDVSRTVRDLATALDLGRKNQQQAIFYLGTFDEIPVGNAEVYGLSQLYAQQMSLPPAVALEYKPVPVERMTLVAEAYDWLRDNATLRDVRIQNVYDTFVKETEKQFDFISQHIRIEPWNRDGQPYANSREMMDDVAKNKHLWVYEGGDPHPFMTPEQNWKFRAVHDLFGHAKTGFEFGPRGEFNATRAHSQMYTEDAWPALVTETIGQNAWVNFGAKNAGKTPRERAYAVQKADLLPESMWRDLLDDPIEARVASVDQHERVMAEKGQRLIEHIRGMIGDAPVEINVFEAKPGQPLGYYQGRVGKMKAVIGMATNAKDELSIADHEGFHALEDMVLDGRERSIIGRQLQPGAELFKRLLKQTRAYDATNGTKLTDEIIGTPQEARAYGYEFWRRGELQVEGVVAKAFEKIRAFIERLVNYLDGLGFQSAEDIFRMIELGELAKKAGYDGIKALEDGHLTWAVFKPEQIKSAIGNNGDFDPNNPNILYSKAATALDREMAKGGQERAQEYLTAADLINSAYESGPDNVFKTAFGSLKSELGGDIARWLKRNILTPNFTSRYSEGFKNVFTTLNTYDRYRSILIKTMLKEKMPGWYDASAEDQKVTFKALLDRTVKGMTVDSAEYNALLAPLTADQRALFRTASTMIEGFLRAELESDKVTYKSLLTTPGEYEKWLVDRTTQVQEMIDKGYVPLRRYGDHTVVIIKSITGKDGNPQDLVVARQGFNRAATAEVAGQMYKDEIARTGADLRVEVGYQHKAARDTTISVQQFIDTARRNGVPLNQLERERIVKALSSAESMTRNRMLHREGTAGYSEDGLRVLNEFGVGMAGKMAYAKFAPAIDAASEGFKVDADIINNEPMISVDESINDNTGKPNNLWSAEGPQSGFHRNLADELTDFVLVPDHTGAWSRNLRGAAMMYFLGGSISGAMVNTMSVPMLVIPQLSVSTGYYNAMSTTLAAWKTTWANQGVLRDTAKLKDATTYPIPEIDSVPGLRQALIQAAEDGRTMDTEIHGIMGMAQGTMYSQSRAVQRSVENWMAPFRVSEQTNRITAFIAGYKIGQENKLTGRDLYNYAGEIVDSTQNNYNEANRPGIARNHIFALMYMFKSFPMFLVEAAVLMHKANPAAARNMLLGMVVMTGVQGLPFAETLMDLIDTISQKIFNSPFNSRRAIRNMVKQGSEAIVGYDLSSIVLRGVINEVLGMSVSSRIGAGDFVPGTRLGTADADQGRVLEAVLGAPYAMMKDTLSSAGKLIGGVTTGDWKQSVDALREGGPIAVRNVIKGAEQLSNGFATDSKGRKIIDVSTPEALWQLTGMASARLAKAYEHDRIDKQTLAFYTQARSEMQSQLVKALKSGDSAKVQETWDAARAWDELYPEMPLRLSASAIRREIVMSGLRLDERTMKMLPRALRGTSLSAEGTESE